MTYKELLKILTGRLWAIKRCGVSIPDACDKSTWALEFVPGTTAAEKAALQQVVADFEHAFVQSAQ